MLNSKGFDLWADGYDKTVGLSDEDGTYPFAGYKDVLSYIYDQTLSSGARSVLDIGFGTATLTSRLYQHGIQIYGQDFSAKMIETAQEKMPDAQLYCGDFAAGLAEELTKNKYDAIIATYSLHHLTEEQKTAFIRSALPLLNDGGQILIGDVAFGTRAELEQCRNRAGIEWDDDEIYFVYEEIKNSFPLIRFRQFSHCAGVFSLPSDSF